MNLIGKELTDEFSKRHANSKVALEAWIDIVERATFKTPVQLKGVFGTADYVKPHTIFDVSGNKYRIIAVINYKLGMVFIKRVLTHAEYDKGEWRL